MAERLPNLVIGLMGPRIPGHQVQVLRTKIESTLPPTDRGWSAWLFLAGCFWLEGLVWGIFRHFPRT